MNGIRLKSVNWEHGMLLTPEHFLRQEQYLESLSFWGLSYLSRGAGLVGGGVRLLDSDLGAVRFDPIVKLDEDANELRIAVSQCRGLTPAGSIVDVESGAILSGHFAKEQLAGVSDAVIYIVCDVDQRVKSDGVTDTLNPQMKTERGFAYRLALAVNAVERENAVPVARIQRPQVGMHYEKQSTYIPPCVSLSAYSELTAGWRKVVESVNSLLAGFSELHRAMSEFLVLSIERGIDTSVDRDSISFVERMVLALQETTYAVLDRTQTPVDFFATIRKLLHQAATFFDLAPGMQQYYETLRDSGETELVSLIELQKFTLQTGRTLKLNEDLGIELRNGLHALSVLDRLEKALEGKYIDFRKSPSLEGANFIFDRGGKVLYRLAAKPSRVQGIVDELTIYFSQLRLEGRDRYRLILVGDRTSPYPRGTTISAEIRLNEGTGFRREAIILTAEAKLDEQYNFEFDFEAPDVPTITDVRVTVHAHHGIKTALLFMRHRFYAGRAAEPDAGLRNPGVGYDPLPPPHAVASYASNGADQARGYSSAQGSREYPSANGTSDHSSSSREAVIPPWSPRKREDTADSPMPDDPNKPRRRRLE